MLSNCSSSAALHRYTLRHNGVLLILLDWLRGVLPKAALLYADLPEGDFLQVRDLFRSCRPDIAVKLQNIIYVLELTICHETNLVKSHDYKKNKYFNLQGDLSSLESGSSVSPFFVEVSVLGLISDLHDFIKSLNIKNLPLELKYRVRKSVIDSSFQIYCNRNNNIIPA